MIAAISHIARLGRAGFVMAREGVLALAGLPMRPGLMAIVLLELHFLRQEAGRRGRERRHRRQLLAHPYT